MSAVDDSDAVDLDERSFNLESVDIVDDDVDVHNGLIGEDRLGVDIDVNINISDTGGNDEHLATPSVDEEKKKEFERQRDDILALVPEEVKARFGEIYFSTFGKFVGPVLIMNPYKVEPGPLRENWLTMFHKCRRTQRETQMTHLTYWYGQFNDLPNAYSFQKTSQLLSYEKGMKKTEKKLKNILQKHAAGKALPSKDFNYMKGFEEMEADRSKNPAERYGYLDSNFLEDYHVLLGEEDDEIKDDDLKNQKLKTKNVGSNTGTKKKRNFKRKGSSPTDKQTTTDPENGETTKPKKKVSKKRSKKSDKSTESLRPKKKKKDVETSNHDVEITEKQNKKNDEKGNDKYSQEDAKGSTVADESVKDRVKNNDDRRLSAYEEFAGLGDVSSHGETDDGSLNIDELESGEDSADEDYVDKSKTTASKKRTTKMLKKKGIIQDSLLKTKILPKKKVQKTKIKVESSIVKDEKNGPNKSSLKKLLKMEQRKFHKCEIKFLPLLHRWEKAIKDRNGTQLSTIFEELLTSMDHFTAPFIEEYGMSDLMKRSKGYDNEKRKKVLTKFKTIYKEKKDEVPKGFKAKKETEKYVIVDVNAKVEVENEKHSKLEKDTQNLKEVVGKVDISHAQDTMTPSIPVSSSKICQSESNGEMAPTATLEPSSKKHMKGETSSNLSSQKRNLTSVKKRFSLEKLVRAGSSSSQAGNVGMKLKETSMQQHSQATKNTRNRPSWTTQFFSDADYSNEDRAFGLEFLQQAALYIPESKTMNYEAVARNIEVAVYNWSAGIGKDKNKNHNNQAAGYWLDKYWNKIHDISACISGKRKDGTLARMIGEGKFETPDKLVCLSDDDLWRSFESSSLSKF